MTSLTIHLKPMITMTNLHWSTQYNKERGWDVYDSSEDTFSFSFLYEYFRCCSIIYFSWAAIYFLIIFIVKRKKIKERNYDTLFKYLSSTDPVSRKLYYSMGKKYAALMFMATHIVTFLILTFISFLCYFSFWLNIALVFT
mmetsp:Transcript_16077/g.17860  ORF Transcript_16077/g.17860 Transcript_16077/m.17860 type:complete len:141 (-) Transcript_16077:177-599(-)